MEIKKIYEKDDFIYVVATYNGIDFVFNVNYMLVSNDLFNEEFNKFKDFFINDDEVEWMDFLEEKDIESFFDGLIYIKRWKGEN
jgi:hypothetical protein